MKIFARRMGAALAIACLFAGPALADNYQVKDGNGSILTMAAKLFGGFLHPMHVLEGLIGGTGNPQPVNVDGSGNVGVNIQSIPAVTGTVSITGTLPAFGATPAIKVVDSGGADATDTTNHAVKTTGQPGEAHVGLVGGVENTVSATPTVQAAAYALGNCMGSFNALTLARVNGGTGIITNVRLTSIGGSTQVLTVYLFDANPSASTCTDKSTFTLNSADVDKLIVAPFTLTPAAPTGTTVSTAEKVSINVPYIAGGNPASGVKTIYFALVAGGAVTPASTTDVHVRVGAAND